MLDDDVSSAAQSPDPQSGPDAPVDEADGDEQSVGSLTDDLTALIDDGKTYVEAEFAYQKTRLSFVANRGKSGFGFVLAALGLLHLAFIGLTVGAIISLIPIAGPVGATMLVVGLLLLGTAILLFKARDKFTSLADAFKDDRNG